MNTPTNKKYSDVSSDSSWTFINCSRTTSRNNSSENIFDTRKMDNIDNDTEELLEATVEILDQVKTRKDIDGQFELLQKNTDKPKKKKTKFNKQKSPNYLNILSIIACLLTMTGITLFTTFLPSSYTESTDIEVLQQNLAKIYENTNNPSAGNVINSIQATLHALENTRSMDVLNLVSQNISEEMCDAIFEGNFSNNSFGPENISRVKINLRHPYAKENLKDSSKIEDKLFTSSTQSILESAQSLINNPSLQMLVATLVQDLCLIKLVNEFSKRTKNQTSSEEEEKIKYPRNTTSEEHKNRHRKKKGSIHSQEKKKKSTKNKHIKRSTTTVLPEKQLLTKISSVYHNETNLPINENGKSECERRFEELDNRWSTLGESHRNKIQQIKNKFQKEIIQIKEQETESLDRKQKIRFTREKFIQRLKADREKYLHKLRKLRQEKQKALVEICQNFKNLTPASLKDVSVGNVAVNLSSDYDFLTKLNEIRQKEQSQSKSKLEATNNEIFSYIPKESNRIIPVEDESNIKDEIQKNVKKSKEKINQFKNKRQRKKNRIANKTEASEEAEDVRNVIRGIVTCMSEATSKSLIQETSETTEKPPFNPQQNTELQIVETKKGNKRNLSKLYDIAFEDHSKKIRQQDITKWHKNFDDLKWPTFTNIKTKKDPKKAHRQKIIHKGLL